MRIAQAIDVIDAQASDPPSRDELPDFRVNGLEYGLILDPQPREIVDIEKAALIDLASSERPIGDAVSLAFEKVVQSEQRARLARFWIERPQAAIDHILGVGDY